MRLANKSVIVTLLSFALTISYLSSLAIAIDNSGQQGRGGGTQEPPAEPKVTTIEDIEKREKGRNGITVGKPKVYDNALLQQMLQQAEARLAALQLLEQKPIADKIGALTGASQQISSFALNAQGVPLPNVLTTTKGSTGSTQEVAQVNAAGATTSSSLTTNSGLGTQDVVTTRAPFAAPTATTPPQSTTLPPTFSVSASDILNEQMQLTAEIHSLRLLLEGALSDFFVMCEGQGMTPAFNGSCGEKLKTTLGFPISIMPDNRHKSAVAVVEVEVERGKGALSSELPAITSLLPLEKTYNVASITDRSVSIGGGVATQILGVSGSWLRGHKTYYVVRDQDTVALNFQPEKADRIGFMWQFRPVLGQEYVKSGLKQTFAQLAFAVPKDAVTGEIGKVSVRTYWRRYDRKKGIVKEVIPDSLAKQEVVFDIPQFPGGNLPGVFNARDNLEDLGGGQILVKLRGRILPRTYVRIGSTLLTEWPRLTHEYDGIRFIAPISDLATQDIFLVRNGTEVPLKFSEMLCSKDCPIKIVGSPRITMSDEMNSLLEVKIDSPRLLEPKLPPLVLIIGSRVFGYSDAPITRDVNTGTLSALVPTVLLLANPEIKVSTLFPPDGCSATKRVDDNLLFSQIERMIVLEQKKSSVKFLLYGNRLKDAEILFPVDVKFENVGNPPTDGNTIRLVELNEEQLKAHKHLLVRRGIERPFLVQIPTLPTVETKKPDPPKAQERAIVDANEAVIVGEGMKDLEKVTFNKKSVPFEIAEDGKRVRLTGLRSLGVTSTAGTQTVELLFKSNKAPVKIEVVSAKLETVQK